MSDKKQAADKQAADKKQALPAHLRGADEKADVTTPQFEIHASGEAGQFFAQHNISIAATAYKSNLVFTFGATDDSRLACFYSVYPHPMAIHAIRNTANKNNSKNSGNSEVWIACHGHLVRCAAVPEVYNAESESSGGGGDFTASLAARQLYAIGKHDIHSINAVSDTNRPYFVSTSFSALCQLDPQSPSVTTNVVWKPPFISAVRAEDRCHLNGVCFVDGVAAYATAICESDAHDGWRDHRANGGVVIDVASGKIVARNLSMPHSPVYHKKALWILNSGTGELGTVDVETGVFDAKVFIPGFLRGLKFVSRYAIVGSSLDRHERRFQGLDLGAVLETKKTTPVCGIFIIDLATMSIAHKIELKGNIHEMYDIDLIPGRRARIIGLNDTEATTMFSIVEPQQQQTPSPPPLVTFDNDEDGGNEDDGGGNNKYESEDEEEDKK